MSKVSKWRICDTANIPFFLSILLILLEQYESWTDLNLYLWEQNFSMSCKIPLRDNHELTLWSLQNIKEGTVRSAPTSASFDPKRRFLWKSMNPSNQLLGKHPMRTSNYLLNCQNVLFIVNVYQNQRKDRTLKKSAFFRNPVSEFWTKTEISLKITEPNQPATNSHHIRTTNYLQIMSVSAFPVRKHSRSWLPLSKL